MVPEQPIPEAIESEKEVIPEIPSQSNNAIPLPPSETIYPQTV